MFGIGSVGGFFFVSTFNVVYAIYLFAIAMLIGIALYLHFGVRRHGMRMTLQQAWQWITTPSTMVVIVLVLLQFAVMAIYDENTDALGYVASDRNAMASARKEVRSAKRETPKGTARTTTRR